MDKIVDIHTHILYGIDDGAKDIDDSIEIIDYLYRNGVTDIVLTSHYIENTKYCTDVKTKKALLEKILDKIDTSKINLYLGNEVYISDNIIELLKENKITTLNDSRYMLIELPLSNYLNNLQNILCELISYGIVPIIAHPERYKFLQNNRDRISELLEFNCLLQCNVDSLTGKYGRDAKKLMKWLLKKDLVQFVATDTHRVGSDERFEKAYIKLRRIVGSKKFKLLTRINPLKVLNNQEISGNLEYLIEQRSKEKYNQ